MLLELLVQVFADADVLEHPLQLGRVLEAARLLSNNNKGDRLSGWELPASLLAVGGLTFSLEIMLASASSLALFWWTSRLASILA